MKIQSQTINQIQTSGTGEPANSEKTKQKETPAQSYESKPASQAESTSKKAEMKMAGEAQATAIRWKMDEQGKLWSVLKRGSEGPQVKELQERLNETRQREGLDPIKVDGKYGKETEQAVRDFQDRAVKNGKLNKADGVAGPQTELLLGVHPRYMKGSKGESVTAMQEHLNTVRAAAGQPLIKVDGIYGKETEAAVADFQKNMELKSDGVIGQETGNTLPSAAAEIQSKIAAHYEAEAAAAAEVEKARVAESEAQALQAQNEDLLKAVQPGSIASDGKD
jgi:peptidoglycan hydrolase-like protein with peptidoglycan-binding domain